MPFAQLDADQQRDFRQRLSRLDVDETALIAEELVVPEGATVQLSPAPESGGEPRRLVTRDLDTLRRWIGTPDALADDVRVKDIGRHLHRFPGLETKLERPARPRRSVARAQPAAARLELKDVLAVDVGKLTGAVDRFAAADERERLVHRLPEDDLEALRLAAYTYVHGDKSLVEGLKPAVEKFFGTFEIWAWLYTEIRVKKNAVLLFGPGANVATAYRVVLEQGARIRSYGHLTVDCTQLRKESGAIVLPGHVFTNDITIQPRRPL